MSNLNTVKYGGVTAGVTVVTFYLNGERFTMKPQEAADFANCLKISAQLTLGR